MAFPPALIDSFLCQDANFFDALSASIVTNAISCDNFGKVSLNCSENCFSSSRPRGVFANVLWSDNFRSKSLDVSSLKSEKPPSYL